MVPLQCNNLIYVSIRMVDKITHQFHQWPDDEVGAALWLLIWVRLHRTQDPYKVLSMRVNIVTVLLT